MPERRVAAQSNNTADPEKGTSLHGIPFLNSENAVAQKRRKKWIDFVLARRKKNWKPVTVVESLQTRRLPVSYGQQNEKIIEE